MMSLNLRVGEWVDVRSKDEILSTLDKKGQMEGLPFMPQMFQHCEKRFRVFKRAHKTCDTVNQTGGRRMSNAVHLELRCDGAAYGGCQAACLIFWKEAWLKRVNAEPAQQTPSDPIRPVQSSASESTARCTEEDVLAGTRAQGQQDEQDPIYVCQATQVPAATTPLRRWDLRQYAEDYRSGNVGLGRIFCGAIYANYYNLSRAGLGLGRVMRWLYDRFQALRGGLPYPRKRGTIPAGQRTPPPVLSFQPGEWVRVKPYEQILATLDTDNKNRGLYFDAEAVPFCGGIYRVLSRVNRIVDEKSGKLLNFKNECVILEGVWCQARYSDRRMFCPRSIYAYWREIWLERVPEGDRGLMNSAGCETSNSHAREKSPDAH
jgi:hypothetical protein